MCQDCDFRWTTFEVGADMIASIQNLFSVIPTLRSTLSRLETAADAIEAIAESVDPQDLPRRGGSRDD